METGICKLAIIAMRANPSDKAEMVSQLIYGETYDVLDFQLKWVLIRTHYDDYEGWISRNQFSHINQSYSDQLNSQPQQLVSSFLADLSFKGACKKYIGFGSRIFNEDDEEGKNEGVLSIQGEIQIVAQFQPQHILDYAKSLIGVPYLWGGRSVFGMDCSGFTQLVYKAAGYKLARDANQQILQGEQISFIQESLPGDLAFFDNEEGEIVHVAIFIDSKTVIHASGAVRTDTIDHYGIYNEELGKYTHHLRLIKRI